MDFLMPLKNLRSQFSLPASAILFIALFLLGFHVQESAASEPSTLPTPSFSLLLDPSRNLSIADILTLDAPTSFKAITSGSINLGYITDAAWIRMEIPSGGNQPALLSLTPNFVDLLDIYVGSKAHGAAEGAFRHWTMGDNRPMTADAMSGLDNVVPIDLQAGLTTIVYIRAAAVNSNLSLSATLYSPINHTLRTTVSGLMYGTWFGGMAVLLTIQLVFYHFDRKPYYLLLALATFVAMLVYTGILGLSRLFLFAQGGAGNDIFTAATTWFGLTASSLAAASILDLPRTSPWLNRLFLLGAALGVVGVGYAACGNNLIFAPVGSLIIIVLSTVAAFHALWTANSDGMATRLRAAAFIVLWIGLAATLAQRQSIAPLPIWVAHSYAMSCVIQTILLTAALGVRLREAESKNSAMHEEVLAAAMAAEQHANLLVIEKTRELAHAKALAEEALGAELASQEQQVRFMEVLGHQYRTPLAAIRSHVDAINVSLSPSDHRNRRRIERVRLGIVRLVEVLEVNLARSRLQGSAFKPLTTRVAVSEVVGTAAARARDLLQREIEVTLDPEASEALVIADTDMLGIAIINLLENAAKFSALREKSSIRLNCSLMDDHAVLSVEDQGMGIPQQEIAGIFDRAVRGSNARNIAGNGIGLSLVQRIVSAHGGRLEIRSSIGMGTTVTISLPLG